ncbi:hypothetical protein Cylst_1176 [Cylindrospermum stagnale PCC 7417]|uniref:Cytoskeleton protein RodZ-like C-terminal domain-containing protein n=1 Tax=Cylindrospermum stagnale PCC 7417 TaxID=56107 RepID=K9WTC9_9NOST|nr:RodZ domain-containing protein [Cylindrospermum stagnale]AFZ23478.1 hypothetical protein Cylst_1176 [Cylindrospermum stagnale PCC 7417]
MTLLNEAQEKQLKEISTHLRQVRQAKSLSIEDIAAQTLIRLVFLQALEEWRFVELPEPVYIQGFIRRYADALGLDGNALANSLVINFIPIDCNNHSYSLDHKLNIQIPLIIVYILLLVAASAGLFYRLNPKLTAEFLLVQRQNPLPQGKQKILLSPLNSLAVPSPSSTDISTVKVTLELQGRSQLQVKADGKTEFEGILTKGERKSWTAKRHLTVSSGNAGAVLVSVNQQQLKPLGGEGEVKVVTYTPEIISR